MTTKLQALSEPFKAAKAKIKLKLPRGWDIRFSPRFLAYTPTYEIDIETKAYRLETASSMNDLLEVFQLRHQVFLEETGAAAADSDGFDVDQFDSICDHIIIRSRENDQIVGTYRVISSLYSDEFYSQTEFNLDQFMNANGHKLELGRACIHHGHRNGAVIDLLWRGIAEYIKLSGSQFLFGCSSLKITDPAQTKGILNYLQNEGHCDDEYGIRPIGQFNMDLDQVPAFEFDPRDAKGMIPPLLRSYFSAGSKIYGQPALDLDFKCVDFLTILNMDQLTTGYRRRYFREL